MPGKTSLNQSPLAKKYRVHSAFLTVQGEGSHMGRAAVFVRFSGCNVWSGKEETRAKSKSPCGLICDTAFFGHDKDNNGGWYTATELLSIILRLWGLHSAARGLYPLAVLTGGEPTLALDEHLVTTLSHACDLHLETNGSVVIPCIGLFRHISVSPKPPMPLLHQRYSDAKVLFPLYDPMDYRDLAPVVWVQPVENEHWDENMRMAAKYVQDHAGLFRLGIQAHKFWGLQ